MPAHPAMRLPLVLLLGFWLALSALPALAKDDTADAVAAYRAVAAELRQRWLPALRTEIRGLRAESAAGIDAVGAGATLDDMEAALAAMDAALGQGVAALGDERLVLAEVTAAADRFTRAAASFGSLTEALVGGEPRFEPLRLEDGAARRRLLALADAYNGFSSGVSRLLGLLPDAIEARHRALSAPR